MLVVVVVGVIETTSDEVVGRSAQPRGTGRKISPTARVKTQTVAHDCVEILWAAAGMICRHFDCKGSWHEITILESSTQDSATKLASSPKKHLADQLVVQIAASRISQQPLPSIPTKSKHIKMADNNDANPNIPPATEVELEIVTPAPRDARQILRDAQTLLRQYIADQHRRGLVPDEENLRFLRRIVHASRIGVRNAMLSAQRALRLRLAEERERLGNQGA
ncbi:hypothetical protein QBC37DRAFT_374962 [Rhypophila decipiens]|uniref:Uncharacterized protein n=1 Tax=Rhypophila decipiens TaxID=261697 RepID=A0AAN7B4K2_9PEZI|nr:hypothetical protein QBC37DRAFT_374962 [Rhypophila decipiens]